MLCACTAFFLAFFFFFLGFSEGGSGGSGAYKFCTKGSWEAFVYLISARIRGLPISAFILFTSARFERNSSCAWYSELVFTATSCPRWLSKCCWRRRRYSSLNSFDGVYPALRISSSSFAIGSMKSPPLRLWKTCVPSLPSSAMRARPGTFVLYSF